jgi:hypothetical protein
MTAMDVSVIIPFRGGDYWRDNALAYVVAALESQLSFELVLADDPHPTFNRGRAINAGVRQSTADVLVFADADLWVPPAALRYAITVVHEYGMVVPFDHLIGLTAGATEEVFAGADPARIWPQDHVELDWRRKSVGGCNIVRREVFDLAGGFDERFEGWGFEDSAFEAAVSTLAGPVGWVPARAVHLYHPTDPTRGTDLTDAGRDLADTYQLAYGNVDKMLELIAREVVA